MIREFTSRKYRPEAAPPPEAAVPGEGVEPLTPMSAGADEKKKEPRVKNDAGLNRFVWNLRHADANVRLPLRIRQLALVVVPAAR